MKCMKHVKASSWLVVLDTRHRHRNELQCFANWRRSCTVQANLVRNSWARQWNQKDFLKTLWWDADRSPVVCTETFEKTFQNQNLPVLSQSASLTLTHSGRAPGVWRGSPHVEPRLGRHSVDQESRGAAEAPTGFPLEERRFSARSYETSR